MYVPRAMYSFRMSFCVVPVRAVPATPCSSPTSSYNNINSAAGALIVIDVDTLPSGMPSKRVRMSSTESIATPTLPTSPSAIEESES